MSGLTKIAEELYEKEYYVIDILPEQVQRDAPGQYFAVDEYYREPERIAALHRSFTDILLKLNCYYDFFVYTDETDAWEKNPVPERLSAMMNEEKPAFLRILTGENTLIAADKDDTYMTVYAPTEKLLARVRKLADAEGLFVWQPGSGEKSLQQDGQDR